MLDVQLKEDMHIDMHEFKDKLRKRFIKTLPDTDFSFEPGDLVTQIMNLGSPTPIQVRVTGHDLTACKQYAGKILTEMRKIPKLRDLEWGQPLDYPTTHIEIDRELAGQLGVTAKQVGMSLQPAYFSSRFVHLSLWRDPDSGFSYQLQVQVPQNEFTSKADIEHFPTMPSTRKEEMDHHDNLENPDINKDYPGAFTRRRQHPLIQDVAKVEYGTSTGEFDRYNMMRMVSLTANLAGNDLGAAGDDVRDAVKRAGAPPKGVFVKVAGQIPLLDDTFFHLLTGLVLAVVVITLMLLAYFQVAKVVLIVMSTTPAILLGVLTMLTITGTTLNIQSFMGAIMAVGVGIANAILLVVFAEDSRRQGRTAEDAAINGAQERMRPILMTSIAMISGMVPMAISAGQSAPLGRAVIGGLSMSTLSVLTLLPLVFAIIQKDAPLFPESLHPEDKRDCCAIEEKHQIPFSQNKQTGPPGRRQRRNQGRPMKNAIFQKRNMIFVLSVLAIAGLAFYLLWERHQSPTREEPAKQEAPLSVPSVKVVSRTLFREDQLPGEIDAYQDVLVYPKVPGFVKWIGVDRGSVVKEGQVMVRMYAPEYLARRNEALARISAARADLSAEESRLQDMQAASEKTKSKSVRRRINL